MTAREQRLATQAEMASLRADPRLIADVTRELREMVQGGRLRGADRAMEGMTGPTVRLLALAALGGLDQLDLDGDSVADLVALRQREYDDLLKHENAGEADLRARAEQVGTDARQKMEQRHDAHEARRRDRDFIERLERRRRRS